MDNQLATTEPQQKQFAVGLLADRLNVDKGKLLSVLKATVFRDARNDEELYALAMVANTYGLNPLTKEIFAFPAKGGGIVPVVSVDGWIRMVNDHPSFDGMDFEFHYDDKKELYAVTCTIWRKDRTRPIKITEYLVECYRNTEPWKMKHRMLRHKAFKECARVAFGFSGVTDEDEGETMRMANATEIPKANVTDSTPGTKTADVEVLPPSNRRGRAGSAKADTTTTAQSEEKPAAPAPTTTTATTTTAVAKPTTPSRTPAVDPAPGAIEETGGETGGETFDTPHAALEAKLKAAGFSPELCIQMAVSMALVKPGATSLLEIKPGSVAAILEDWETASDTMKELLARASK